MVKVEKGKDCQGDFWEECCDVGKYRNRDEAWKKASECDNMTLNDGGVR